MLRRLHVVSLTVLAALVWAAVAQAKGGNYVFDGGSARQQAQVRVALEASAFNWSVVPHQIVIHLRKGNDTYAKPGEIWVDTNLLTSGAFAWGPIQHEYAHQVDFFLLDNGKRQFLNGLLGGSEWSTKPDELALGQGPAHAALGAERFASTLAWAYWQAPENSLRPRSKSDEAAAMEPGKFRQLVSQMLRIPNPLPPVITAS